MFRRDQNVCFYAFIGTCKYKSGELIRLLQIEMNEAS